MPLQLSVAVTFAENAAAIWAAVGLQTFRETAPPTPVITGASVSLVNDID